MKVLKFGGTSVGSVENIRRIGEIVSSQNGNLIVVVSALGGITDRLHSIARKAASGMESSDEIAVIRNLHGTMAESLLKEEVRNTVLHKMADLFDELEKIIEGVRLINELTPKTLDKILGSGERMSSVLISTYLNAPLIDSSALIKTDRNFGKANVDLELSYRLIRENCSGKDKVAVAPGFISSTLHGSITTLGRGGSDYTAAIFAAALDADKLEIWTDVNGFMTADPKIISKAYTIPRLTYSEAMELSHFGAKVIYPPTILPVLKRGIPILIKNTFNPQEEGSLICQNVPFVKDHPVKGISSISGITLYTIQGIGMVGVAGISMRLFGALAKENINVILISQASSENSISFAIDSVNSDKALKALNDEFAKELASGAIGKLFREDNLSIVAIVGENMKHSAGIAGKLFQTLGKNGINVIAIAQGASEQNISWVVKDSDLNKSLNVVHESFFLSPNVELNIFLVGVGTVGRSLLLQINQQQEKLRQEHRLVLKITGVADVYKMVFNRDGIDIPKIDELMQSSSLKTDINKFCQEMVEMNLFNSVFVDCTADQGVASKYHFALDNFISVVAANKIAASSEYKRYRELKELAAKHSIKFLFETNVGAGLPLISTINDLMRSGDRILRIEAVLSGTLNFIFNTLSKEISFSQAIKMAKEKGYSEPDPRVDLSGVDVIRKIVILSRESGYALEKENVMNIPFIPERYFNSSLEDFWNSIHEMDEKFEQERVMLEKDNKRWRYVAVMDQGKASVSLRTVDLGHPFFDLEGSNNIVLLTSERYNEYPMLIQGYGAGAAVTAAGVFADLIKVSNI